MVVRRMPATDVGRHARMEGQRRDRIGKVDALEREVAREERMREFVREALAADTGVEEGAAVYRAADVHTWLERLARNPKTARPKAWRR